MFCLFVRFLPMVATAEVKTVLPQADPHWQPGPEQDPRSRTIDERGPVGRLMPAPAGASKMPLLPRLPEGLPTVLAEFATPADLHHACARVRDAGYTRWDAHTPFPVHGLEGAMGLRRSTVPWIVLVMGLMGAALGFGLTVVGPHQRLPLVISGKPFFSWPAFIPITFEVAVLFARSAPSSACSA